MIYSTVNILFIFLVTAVGIIISYEDIKFERIKNKYLTIITIITFFYYLLNFQYFIINSSHIFSILIWAIIWAILFWLADIWPAGDAKLFIVLSIAFPFEVVSKIQIIDFLINIFVPLFLIYVIIIILRSNKDEIKKSLKYAFDPYKIFMVSVVLLGLTWIFMKFLSIFSFIPQNMFTMIIVLFLILEFFDKLIPINMELIYVALAIIRIIIDRNEVYTISFLYNFITILLVFLIFRFFILDLAFKIDTYPVEIDKLKPGMRPAEGIVKKKEDGKIIYNKKKLAGFSFFDLLEGKTEKYIHGTSDEGLTKEDIKKIMKLKDSKNFNAKYLLIHSHLPFAIFLLIGFLLTIFCRGSFITFLKVLI